MLTFSLLPIQLLPYHRYTLASMVFALLVARAAGLEEGLSLFGVAEKRLDEEGRVSGHLLACWSELFLKGLRRAHPWLEERYDLTEVRSGRIPSEKLVEFHSYIDVLMPRAPPGRAGDFERIADSYSRMSGGFLIGVPSQERMGSCVR